MTKRRTALFGVPTLALGVLAGGAWLLAVPASAASSHAVSTPASSRIVSALRSEIQVVLRHAPSGRVINDREVSYDHGHIIITVPVPGAHPDAAGSGCPSGWFCIWSGPDFTSYEARVQAPLQTNISVTSLLPTQKIGSVSNARSTGSILSNLSGHNACYSGGAFSQAVGAPFNTYPYIYLQKNNNC